MASIEKISIPISKAAAIMIFVCGTLITGFGVYMAAMMGVQKGFNNVEKRFSQNDLVVLGLVNENKLQDILIKGNTDAAKFNYDLIKELQEAMKPEEPEIKTNKRYR